MDRISKRKKPTTTVKKYVAHELGPNCTKAQVRLAAAKYQVCPSTVRNWLALYGENKPPKQPEMNIIKPQLDPPRKYKKIKQSIEVEQASIESEKLASRQQMQQLSDMIQKTCITLWNYCTHQQPIDQSKN